MTTKHQIAGLLIAGMSLLPAPAMAWGDYGHRLTARIALAGLSPAARAEVRRILAQGASVDTPDCPLATLEQASTWPDCVRSMPDRFKPSFAWHYQDIEICNQFDISEGCPGGNCVTAQIPRQLAIVADRRASPAARAQALAFFVHFTGDLHQPLHIGENHDRGGNQVPVSYGAKSGPWMNLHRAWDAELAERALTEPPAVNAMSPTRAQRREWSQGTVTDWARESWALSKTSVYGNLHGSSGDVARSCPALPNGAQRTPINLDNAYGHATQNVIRRQVERAGVRIAALLNTALAR